MMIFVSWAGMQMSAYPRCRYPCRGYTEGWGNGWGRNNFAEANIGPWEGMWYYGTPAYYRNEYTCPPEPIPYGVPADIAEMNAYVGDAMEKVMAMDFWMSPDKNKQRQLVEYKNIVTSLGAQFDAEYRSYINIIQNDNIGAQGLEGRVRNRFENFRFEYQKFVNLLNR